MNYQPKDLKINTTDETQYSSQLAVMCFQFLKENKGKSYSPRHLAVQLFGDDGDNNRMKRDSKNVAKVCKHLHRASLIHKDQQNHITLFPAQQSLEEAFEDFLDNLTGKESLKLQEIDIWKAGAKWAKKNNY